MTKEEALEQLEDLIADRKSFITDDKECSEEFEKDINAIKYIIEENEKQDQIIREAREFLENTIEDFEMDDNYEAIKYQFTIPIEILDRNVK